MFASRRFTWRSPRECPPTVDSPIANENGILLNSAHSVRIAENAFSDFNAATGSAIVVQSNSDTARITNNLFGSFIAGVWGVPRPYDDARRDDTSYRGNNRDP